MQTSSIKTQKASEAAADQKKLVFYSEYVYFAHFCNVPTWISSHPNKVKQKTNKTSHFSNGEKTWDLQWCSIIFDDLQAYIYIYILTMDIYIYIWQIASGKQTKSYWKWPSRKFVDLRYKMVDPSIFLCPMAPSHLGPGQVWHVSAGGLDGRVAAEGPVVATWGDGTMV